MDFSHTARKNLNPPTQGDDSGYRLEFTEGGSAVDITGWTITFTAKRDKNDSTPALQVDATIVDAAGGVAEFEFAAADTSDLAGLYYYDIEVTLPNGNVRTIMAGRVPFNVDITD